MDIYIFIDDCVLAEFVKTELVYVRSNITYIIYLYTRIAVKNNYVHKRTREGGRFCIPVMVRVAKKKKKGGKKGRAKIYRSNWLWASGMIGSNRIG